MHHYWINTNKTKYFAYVTAAWNKQYYNAKCLPNQDLSGTGESPPCYNVERKKKKKK
jgi:hypothetical protein